MRWDLIFIPFFRNGVEVLPLSIFDWLLAAGYSLLDTIPHHVSNMQEMKSEWLAIFLMMKYLQHPISQILLISLSISFLYLIWPVVLFPVFGVVVLLLSLLSSTFRDRFLHYFQLVMKAIGKLKTIVFMGLVYYIVLFPLSLVYQLSKRKKTTSSSRFIDRNHAYEPADFEQMW